MTTKKDQDKPEEIIQPESAVTDKYIYLVLDWAGGDHKYLGTPQVKMSVGFSAPYGQEIQIGILRPGGDHVDEKLRPNAITWTEYEYLLTIIAGAKARAAISGKDISIEAEKSKTF